MCKCNCVKALCVCKCNCVARTFARVCFHVSAVCACVCMRVVYEWSPCSAHPGASPGSFQGHREEATEHSHSDGSIQNRT